MILGLKQVCVVLLLKCFKKMNLSRTFDVVIRAQFNNLHKLLNNAVVLLLSILLELLSPCYMIKYGLGSILILGIISIYIDFGYP